jgi:hypothetical protein
VRKRHAEREKKKDLARKTHADGILDILITKEKSEIE